MPTENKKVECDVHGSGAPTYVCQHLASGEGRGVCLGFDPENPLALFPDAWCDSCEAKRSESGEWTDEVAREAAIKLLCSECYTHVCSRNWIEDANAYSTTVSECMGRLQAAQASLIKEFQLNDWERWDWDMEDAQLVFSHGGKRRVIAHVTFVGTYSSNTGTWMWAWGNESLPEAVRNALSEVKRTGERTGFRRFVQGYWKADEYDGWHMAAYAFSILGGLGAYRTPTDNGHIYMVIRDASRAQ